MTKKRLMPLLLLLFSTTISYAQKEQFIRSSFIGISFLFNDYVTPQRIRATSLSRVLKDRQLAKLKEMSPGLGLTYFKGLTNHIDFSGTLTGSFISNALLNRPNGGNNFLMEADASLNFKMFTDQRFFTPYLIAGIGASKYQSYYGAIMPLGGGFKFNFFNEAALFVQGKYHVGVMESTTEHHLVYSLGIAGIIGKKHE